MEQLLGAKEALRFASSALRQSAGHKSFAAAEPEHTTRRSRALASRGDSIPWQVLSRLHFARRDGGKIEKS